jgi:protocatechuate 3,4-dioxygenase beta subunit
MKTKFQYVLLLAGMLVSISNANVWAWDGRTMPPICDMYGRSNVVFVGTITGIKELKRPEPQNSDFEIFFQIRESFLGTEKSGQIKVNLPAIEPSFYEFVPGQTYLVYGYKGDIGINLDAGTRTQHISDVTEDLEFLRSLPTKKRGITIYGNVKQVFRSSLENDNSRPVPKVSVIIAHTKDAEKVYRAVTDENGDYRISNIPAGSYEVSAANVDKDYNTSHQYTFEVTDRGCTKQDISVESKSKVSGKVIDSNGNPVERAEVEIISVNVLNPEYYRGKEFANTDSNGNFTAFGIPPGLYTLSVNHNNPPEDDSPYPPTFYPGVSERSQAQLFEVVLGKDLSGIEFKLPEKLAPVSVTGSVVWSDGTPAPSAKVYVKDHLHDACCINKVVVADDRGRFIVHGFIGRKYRVWATAKERIFPQISIYGVSEPFTLTRVGPKLVIVLNRDENWLTEMDEDNEKEMQNNPSN